MSTPTQRREFDAVLDDLFLVYNIRMERRESLNGHETIVFSLTPRRDAKPRTTRREPDAEVRRPRLGQRV